MLGKSYDEDFISSRIVNLNNAIQFFVTRADIAYPFGPLTADYKLCVQRIFPRFTQFIPT